MSTRVPISTILTGFQLAHHNLAVALNHCWAIADLLEAVSTLQSSDDRAIEGATVSWLADCLAAAVDDAKGASDALSRAHRASAEAPAEAAP